MVIISLSRSCTVNTVGLGAEVLALDADQMSELAEIIFLQASGPLVGLFRLAPAGNSGNQRSVKILMWDVKNQAGFSAFEQSIVDKIENLGRTSYASYFLI